MIVQIIHLPTPQFTSDHLFTARQSSLYSISTSSVVLTNPLPPVNTSTNHLGSSGAKASFPFLALWTIGCPTICWIVGLDPGSADMHWMIKSLNAGERGDRSTTLKSLLRNACHAAPPSGTHMLVDTSRMTKPKLRINKRSRNKRIDSPENIRSHDE